MTVDTVVKIVESEKCGLDLSSYDDLNSSPTSIMNVNGGDVNDSDGFWLDDVTENRENGVVNVAELSVEDDKVNGDVGSESLENGVGVDREDLEVENEINEVEEVLEIGDNGTAYINGIASCSLDGDENSKDSVSDALESAAVEALDSSSCSTVVNNVHDAPEPSEIESRVDTAAMEVPESEPAAEHHIVPPLENGFEIQRTEIQVQKPELSENNDGIHAVEVPVTELESAVYLVTDSKPLETLVIDQSVENGVADDVVSSEQLYDCKQQNLSPADGDDEKRDLIEAEQTIVEQGDVDSLADGGSQESVVSEAAACELGQAEDGEITDEIGLDLSSKPEETPEFQSLPNHSEGVHNLSDLESPGMENPVLGSVDQYDECLTESTFGTEYNGGVLTADTQLDTNDKSAVVSELERVYGDGEFEVMTISFGSLEFLSPFSHNDVEFQSNLQKTFTAVSTSTPANGVSLLHSWADFDQSDESLTESTFGDENNSAVLTDDSHLDTTDKSGVVSELARVYGDGESEVMTISFGSLEFVLSFSHNDINLQSDVQNTCTAVSTSTPANGVSLLHSWADSDQSDESLTKSTFGDEYNSEVLTDNSQSDTTDKSAVVSELERVDGDGKSEVIKMSFGSLDFVSPFSHKYVNLQSDVQNTCTAVSISTPEYNLYPENAVSLSHSRANSDISNLLNNDAASAQVVCSAQTTEDSASSMEGSETNPSNGPKQNADLVRSVYWLVKVPKGDVGGYREQLRQSEIDLEEKTVSRNAFQADCYKQQACCREFRNNLETAKSEAKSAQELVRAKKKEVDSAHSLINLAKNGVTVHDLDQTMHNLEYSLQHETHSLREERELVREIRQLTHQRQQFSANPQKQKEIQQARDQRDHALEQLKVLKKELEALKDNLFKADERVRTAQKKYDDENALLINLRHQVRSANDIRQEAYVRTMTLRKQLREKNATFYNAKRVAYNYTAAGEKDNLERHCANQVETFMELWNKNDKFRKDYIQCNMKHMLWKFGTLDGTQRGINEAPPSFRDVSDNIVNASSEVDSPKARDIEDESSNKEEQKKVTPVAEKSEVTEVSSKIEIEDDKEETKPTKEEEELARKAEQLRREEEAARLNEKRKLEEKAKAEEALEWKRRNAMKAEARAEFKAQKEAERKEKEREKRAKKKEKKRGLNLEIVENEPAQASEHLSKSVNEPEATEKPVIVAKAPRKASLKMKQLKTTNPVPPTLRNKSNRGLLHYWPCACILLLAIAFFFFGSFERIQTIKQRISGLLHR
ncbi:hypothetical protein RND81_13G018600 [Saponaria officinalis]|uniref:Uncharacterized protein n=1 Tax=Saponaria officinalis TaxID=3572 RepID=A0AAW1GXN8_SAPOF